MNTNTHFTSKEHYLAFRAAWANTVNSEKNELIIGAHAIFYSLLRNRAYDKGFTPNTRKTKLQNGCLINHGLYWSMLRLGKMKLFATDMLNDNSNKWRSKGVEEFLSVFEGTVSLQMLSDIELPECKPMDSDYGRYKKVAEYICEQNGHHNIRTFNDVDVLVIMMEEEAAA